MSLPSQEVLNDIKDLISKITGFQEHDENFSICERYCLSHVVHHTYPCVNKSTVKNVVNSYISRFYSHGYFRVSQELNHQVKIFLSNEMLFEKNPQLKRIHQKIPNLVLQYDIQWCLLSLVSALSSNLTSIKELPVLLPTDNEKSEADDFNWKEYLMEDFPLNDPHILNTKSEELSMDEDEDEDENDDDDVEDKEDEGEEKEKENFNEEKKNECSCSENLVNSIEKNASGRSYQDKKQLKIIFDNKILFSSESLSDIRKQKIKEFLEKKRSERNLENDFVLRGNFTETFDQLMNKEGVVSKSQLISEYELMENILFQFQTGEKIFIKKGLMNPALTSLTQDTLRAYLEYLQPYITIIKCFKDFDAEVTKARYPENFDLEITQSFSDSCQLSNVVNSDARKKKIIPNVLYMYNEMLKKSLEPFQSEVTDIVENLENYTLIQMEQKLKPYYWDLTSLFQVHNLATKNWEKNCNWVSSVRILCVLYNAIMDATSRKMNFLYLNFFLHCFQVYLDIIDNWICFVDLIDPKDEFVISKSSEDKNSENGSLNYEIRPYKTEVQNIGAEEVLPLDFICEKMILVGQSLDVLKNLNRFVPQDTQTLKGTSYQLLVKAINEKLCGVGKVNSVRDKLKLPEKQKGIFTVKNINLGLERDSGGGDSSLIKNLLMEILEYEEKKNENTQLKGEEKIVTKPNFYGELINFMVRNHFFKKAFECIGVKQVQKHLEEAKARRKQDLGNETFMIIRKPDDEKSAIYPLHKIISQALHHILVNRVSSACALVKNIVLNECNLPIHLYLLRSILLFNDSYMLQPFILALFTQPIIWESSYSLSLHLKECARSLYKDYANALTVILAKNLSTKSANILEVIDIITVNYEVKWPLTLIITPEVMRKYNEIFRLALKLKWAHWTLCNLYFQDEDVKASKSMRHRLQLLRFWLLSALGRLNNYFLAQMSPLDLKLNACKDLKDIINEHSEYVEKIYHNCLFGEKCSGGRKLILECLIPLCMDVFQESHNLDEAKLSLIEKTFGHCHLLLSRLLTSLEK